jgi:hypothetical protein
VKVLPRHVHGLPAPVEVPATTEAVRAEAEEVSTRADDLLTEVSR